MHHRLLSVTLLSSSLLFGMDPNYPPRVSMVYDNADALLEEMPPARIQMHEYAQEAGKDCSWLHTQEEMAIYERKFTSNSLYQLICSSPQEHTELLDYMVGETNSRICNHITSCGLAIVKPCKFGIFSAYFAARAHNAAQRGENCCAPCSTSCALALITCVQCCKSIRAMRGITKITQKTYTARTLLTNLRNQAHLSAQELEKKTK
ncbi:MAG: hypothetical protein AB7F19_05745 [Candidatus Babeliales bacterium]